MKFTGKKKTEKQDKNKTKTKTTKIKTRQKQKLKKKTKLPKEVYHKLRTQTQHAQRARIFTEMFPRESTDCRQTHYKPTETYLLLTESRAVLFVTGLVFPAWIYGPGLKRGP